MPSHYETKILPYTSQQLFDMVADVARYPEFLPWCSAARILEHTNNTFLAELIISYHHIKESYTSHVTLMPDRAIEVVMVKGPFEYLTNQWKFTPEDAQTRIDFSIDFQFRSKLLEKIMNGFFTKAAQKMMGAFTTRADFLYHNTQNNTSLLT